MVTIAELVGTVSPSKLEVAQQCGAKFFFRYVERQPEGWRADGQLGNAVDATGNTVYAAKLQTGKTMPKPEVADVFAAAWDYESQAVDDWQGQSRGAILDEGVAMVKRWRDDVAQFVGPRVTQSTLRKTVSDTATGERFDLVGVVDLIGSTQVPRAVVDLKQSGKSYNVDKMLRSFQPVAYTLLADTPVFEFHVLVRTKEPKVQVLRASLPDSEREAFVRRAAMIRRQIAHAMRSGDWIPNRGHMLCSRRWCSFWAACEKRFGGTVPA